MNYLKGEVVIINKKDIIVENNGIGFLINVNSVAFFELNSKVQLYIHRDLKLDKKNQLAENLYGFIDKYTHEFFCFLITLQGVGCKIALNILQNDLGILVDLIKNENVWSLCNLKGLNLRIANLLLDEIKTSKKFKHLLKIEPDIVGIEKTITENVGIEDDILVDALKAIGYPLNEIKTTIQIMKDKEQKNFFNLDDAVNACIKTIFLNNEKEISKKFS